MTSAVLALVLLTSCETESESSTTCDDICEELYNVCLYEAYPTLDSCQQGCLYEESEGADMESYLTCIEEAACDTFEILDCERELGSTESDR